MAFVEGRARMTACSGLRLFFHGNLAPFATSSSQSVAQSLSRRSNFRKHLKHHDVPQGLDGGLDHSGRDQRGQEVASQGQGPRACLLLQGGKLCHPGQHVVQHEQEHGLLWCKSLFALGIYNYHMVLSSLTRKSPRLVSGALSRTRRSWRR